MSDDKKLLTSEKELLRLARNYVLPEYNLQDCSIEQIKIKNSAKHRAVYKVKSEDKEYCLKKVYYDEKKLLFMYSAMEWLFRAGFKVPRILATRNNNRYVKINGLLFILNSWVPGSKCDFDNLEHLNIASETLALMHKSAKDFVPIKGSHLKTGYDNLYISINKHFNQLLSSYNQANKKKDKFSRIYLDYFPQNIELAKFALEVSATINFDKLSRSLCHGDYVNKNLLFNDKEVYIIDFDKCSYDYCMSDLSYFLRRLLKRGETKWDFEIAKNIILNYNKANPLTQDDVKYLMVYLSFPQKYWRTSRDYYSSISKCNKSASKKMLLDTVLKTSYQAELVENMKDFFLEKFNIQF